MKARTIVLTGASSGIGAAMRTRLLDEGHTVIGLARRANDFEDSTRYRHVQVDLSQLDGIRRKIMAALSKTTDVDALISNAGQPAFGNLEQLSDADIRGRIDVNLTSHILVTRTLLPFLKQRPTSDVILMGSEAAQRGAKRGVLYCAAKFGLRGFAQALRQECASSGVRVTLINPGMVRTPFFDSLDFGPGEDPENAIEPADVAAAVSMVLGTRSGTVFDEISLSPLTKVVRKSDSA